MDDIDYVLKGESLDRFQRPGVAHAYITNRLNRYLSTKLDHYDFVMCPTEYWQNWDTEYRKDLREGLDEKVIVFWTGYNTVAEYIPNEDGENARNIFGHPLLLWDNYPVNDMAQDTLFMGPLMNRGNRLNHTHIGMLSNPMIQWHLSKIPVITMADYMWNSASYNPEQSYKEAINDLSKGDHELEKALTLFADENRNSLLYYDRKESLDQMIESFDLKGLTRYFNEMKRAVNYLLEQTTYPEITKEALPWLNRFMRDYLVFNRIKKGSLKPSDIAYIESDPHIMGYQVLAKVLKRMGVYQGKIYKKERPNFWDNNKVIKP
jgi:hyaluronoglucosaminidase